MPKCSAKGAEKYMLRVRP